MVNQQMLTGKWNQVRGKLKEKWGKLTDDDLAQFNGNVDQLVGRIQSKTGEARDAIERFLGQVTEEGSQGAGSMREQIQHGAAQMSESARQRAAQAGEALREGYSEAERMVSQRPAQALAVAFGIGLVTGIGIAMLLSERHQPTTYERGRDAAEHLGRQMMDAIASIVPSSISSRF